MQPVLAGSKPPKETTMFNFKHFIFGGLVAALLITGSHAAQVPNPINTPTSYTSGDFIILTGQQATDSGYNVSSFLTSADIGVTVQAWDTDLDQYATLSGSANLVPYYTGSHTMSTFTCTSTCRSLLDDTSTSAMATTLGLVIGTNVEAWDADLDGLAGLGNGIPKRTGGTWGTATSGTDFAPATSGSALQAGNGAGGFTAVSLDPSLVYSGGTLSIGNITSSVFTSSGSLTNAYTFVLCDATSADVVLTVPLGSTYPKKEYVVKRIDSSIHKCSVTMSGSDTLDADTNWDIINQWSSLDFWNVGGTSTWYIRSAL